ncbi:Coq4 family protein [Calothrix sp. 336/3]|uniref:Coq4 family protein n=1 Tax=Calothrix sp. 336/3 TaxID=1337936 RepID=UPI0004E448F8|nr:Coq4 family protein [Calothrix sp. 336/3]AKG23231.1 hypothetical protein IJ00_19875 [Calothrix sp. 336/3]
MYTIFATPDISCFLHQVDQIGEKLGINVTAIINLDELQQLPPDTLGHILADHFTQNQLPPFTTGPRRKQLHDAVHVLTGYGTDPVGEAEVQAFLLGAKFSPIQIVLGLGLLGMIYRFSSSQGIYYRLWQAYQRGQASSFDIDTWQAEEEWHLPLSQVQKMYRIA